jgi:hypothetical protein
MALNPFFLQGSQTERGLVQDLVNEHLKIYGVDIYYIPRLYFNEKTIIEEVINSDFKYAYPIEAYVETYDGYGNVGTLMSKFGIQELDDLTLTISRERYEVYLKPLLENLPNVKLYSRPKEGDLVYFPLGDRLFEIKYVEHEKPFYSLKGSYTYELKCELFRYNNENIDTGIEFIDDNVQNEGYTQTFKMIGIGSLPVATSGLVFGGVRYINLTNRGKGYKSTPVVAISSSPDPNGTASGIATMIGGLTDLCEPNSSLLRIQGVELTKTGYGYTTTPSVTFIGGGGSGAAAKAVIGNGIVGIVTILSGGYGYVDPPVVTISAPGTSSTSTASLTGNINSSGFVTSISINDQQGFFDNTREFNFPNPILTNALLSPVIDVDTRILNIPITNPGAGYTTTVVNTIKFTGGGLTTSTYKFGSSSGYLDGTTLDIVCNNIGSDIFRNGRVDFFLKLKNTFQPGTIIYSKGLYGSYEWKIDLKSNSRLEVSILNGLETLEVPINLNDDEWHFISFQKTQNPYSGYNTFIVVDGNQYVLSSGEPNLYVSSEGILIKHSVNTSCYIDEFRIENDCQNYDVNIPVIGFTTTANTLFLHTFEHATALPIISNGKLSSLNITYNGSGYSGNPIATVNAPTKLITAKGRPVVNNSGYITSILVTNPGFGYSTSPQVSIATTSFQKIRAEARANIDSSGTVTSISIINAGLGYTQSPTISFSAPPTTGIGSFSFNEIVVGTISSTRGKVKSWDGITRTLVLSNINGEFSNNEYLVGETSGASYKIKLINTDNLQDPFAQNYTIQQEASEIIDFSETNPFGTV